MISIGQMIISLFTTGGKFNPLALIIFSLTAMLFYQHILLKGRHSDLVRQHEIIAKANKYKVKTINEARNDQEEARKVIDSGGFDNDFLKRLQKLD